MAAESRASAQVLFSGSVFNNTGESPLFFPEYDTPQNNYGEAIDMTGEKGYHFFSTLIWRNWTVTAAFSGDSKIQPISWGPTIFNDRGTRNNDKRNFVDAAYERRSPAASCDGAPITTRFITKAATITRSATACVEDNRQSEIGNWVGTQLTYRVRPFFAGDVTVGVESNVDLQAFLTDYDVSPAPVEYLSTNHPDRSLALFVQDEKKLSRRWKLDLGIRFDKSHYRRDFVSPRAALIYQPRVVDLQVSVRPQFSQPQRVSAVLRRWHCRRGQSRPAPGMGRHAGGRCGAASSASGMNLQASAYGYRLHDFLVGVYLPNGLLQYQNTPGIHAEGIELEINGRPANWLEATASYAVQRSRDDNSILENSPDHLAKLHFAVPLGRKFDLSSGMQYESSRWTLAGNSLKPLYLADFTLTSKHLLRDLDVRLGMRNAFNRNYSDPIALNPSWTACPSPDARSSWN